MKKLMKMVLSALCLVLCAGVARAATVDVGQISDTERICWENEKLYRVKGGVSMELPVMFVSDDTSILEGDKWYVVKGVVNHSGSISVGTGGAANLVLLDGAVLTVDSHFMRGTPGIELPAGCSLNIFGTSGGVLNAWSGKNAAGIGGGDGQGAGMLTVYGGRVTATGGDYAAGIGGGWDGAGGTVTITGGRVTATGGKNGAGIGGGWDGAGGTVKITGGRVTTLGRDGGKGIGGGEYANGGSVKITGGTVIADVADGGNGQGLGGTVTIDGGSIKTKACERQPKNGAGKDVCCVTVELSEELRARSEELRVEGLDGYGKKDIYPVDGRVYLYLPDGTHCFTVSDGSTKLDYCAVVKGRDVTVEPLPPVVDVGFFVNGTDVGERFGKGWSYANEVLTFERDGEYVLSGVALENEVQIKVMEADARVILSNVVVITSGRAALEVGENASLLMAGDTSYLMTTNGTSAVTVAAGRTITVDLGDGGDRLESMICVFDFDNANAIGGGGTVKVDGGTFFVWSDAPAFASGTGISCGEGVVMKTGDDPETATFADKAGDAPCVLVAPVVTVTVANDIPHVSIITVSNAVERIEGEEIADSMIYRVMLEDDIFVGYTVDAGYVSQVGNPLAYFAVEDENITIDAEVLKVVAPVTPGQAAGPFATPEAAAEAAKVAEFTPSAEVKAALGTDEALATYRDMFTFKVVEAEGNKWAVEAVLTPEAESNLVENASAATRQIPVGDIAALGSGEPTDVTVGGCVPGLYYTLRGSESLGGLEGLDVYGPVLCGELGEVIFPRVTKPSDAAGFFTVTASPEAKFTEKTE